MTLDEQVMRFVKAANAALTSRGSDEEDRAMWAMARAIDDTVDAVHAFRKKLEDD